MKFFWFTIVSTSAIVFIAKFIFTNNSQTQTPQNTLATNNESFIVSSGREGVVKGFPPLSDKRTTVEGWEPLPKKRESIKGFKPLEDKRTTIKGWNTNKDDVKRKSRQQ